MHMIRGRRGPLPCLTFQDQGFSVQAIKEWRASEFDAGRPSGLDDFYAAHGLCLDCQSTGVLIVERRKPADRVDEACAVALGIENVPIYERCSTCDGSGRANRAQWKTR